MANGRIKHIQKYVDSLYEQYEANENERTKLLKDPNVKRYAFISEENQTLMVLLQEAKLELQTLKMEECNHIFLKMSDGENSWNVCLRCGATNKYKVMNQDSMSFEQQEIFSAYKKSANQGIFLESDDDITDYYIKDVYKDIVRRHPDASAEEIVELLDEYINVKKINPR